MLSKIKNLREEREQGFTLIELLVVILIIGILSAIAIPAFMNQRKSAVDATVQSDVANVAKQIESEAVKNAHSPVQDQEISNTGVSALAFISPIIIPVDTKVSDGTVVHVYGNGLPGQYCVVGVNLGGDVSKDGISYDSLAGGLNKSGEACADDNADNIADKIPEVVSAAENLKPGGAVEAPDENETAGEVVFTHSGEVEIIGGDRQYGAYEMTATVISRDSTGNLTVEIKLEFDIPANSEGYARVTRIRSSGGMIDAHLTQLSNGTATGTLNYHENSTVQYDSIPWNQQHLTISSSEMWKFIS